MADGRRRRWVAHDVYFLDDGLGATLFDRFGAAGVALWHGFIAACKKNHVEGQVTYSSDAEALMVFGLPGMPLADADGDPFTLDEFFKVCGDHKVTRRSNRSRRVKVVCTRWEGWQQVRDRRSADAPKVDDRRSEDGQQRDSTPAVDGQTRRSGGETRRTKPAESRQVSTTDLDLDLDLDLDTDKVPPNGGGDVSPNAGTLMAEHLDALGSRPPARVVGHTSREVKALLSEGFAPDAVRAGLARLREKSLNPAALASCVNEHLNPPTTNGSRPKGPTRPPAGDDVDYAAGWGGRIASGG